MTEGSLSSKENRFAAPSDLIVFDFVYRNNSVCFFFVLYGRAYVPAMIDMNLSINL